MVSERLLSEAQLWMEKGPFSVTHKTAGEFTGDIHDYASGRLYWWKEGDEYVWRDGQPNPDNRSAKYDRQRLEDFIVSVIVLTLAARRLGEKQFAERAAEYVRVWFLDPATVMNPHLEYAQLIPGKKAQGLGIIDTYDFYYMLDAVESLVRDGYLTASEDATLQQWFRALTLWLMSRKQGKKERERINNHGTSFDVQTARYLLFSGQALKAKWFLWKSRSRRIGAQIDPNGKQPAEARRSKSLYYHWYNLTKLLHLSLLGSRAGINLMHYKGKLKTALEYLTPFMVNQDSWPLEQMEPVAEADLLEPIWYGAKLFGIKPYIDFLENNPEKFCLFDLPWLMAPPPSVIRRNMTL